MNDGEPGPQEAGPYTSVSEWWSQARLLLTPREQQILADRFPDEPRSKKTLEEIGVALGVTRERVRQVRNAALKKLDDGAEVPPQLDRELWNRLSIGGGFVSLADPAIESKLSGVERLFLRAKVGGIEQWLAHTSRKVGAVYYRGALDSHEILAATAKVEAFCDGRPLQLVGDRWTEEIPWMVSAAASDRVAPLGDYVCHKPITRYRRRAVRLHEDLVRRAKPTSVMRLWAHAREREAGLSIQDVQRTVNDEELGHLFLDCGDYGVCALGTPVPSARYTHFATDYLRDVTGPARERLMTAPSNQGSQTIAGQLADILAETGPLPSRELLQEFEERTAGQYSRSSAAAVLVIFGSFLRMAPGVYGLPRHLVTTDPITQTTDFLLSEDDLNWYTLARSAGEPLNAFPLWTPAMEWMWVQWAQGNASPTSFESLLRVIDPERWPVADRIKRQWYETAHRLPLRESPRLPDSLHMTSVDVEGLVAVGVVARSAGSMSWVRANRILGKRLDASTGVVALGLLMLMGEIAESQSWWTAHPSRADSSEVLRCLRSSLNQTRERSWDSPEVGGALGRLAGAARGSQISWISDRLAFDTEACAGESSEGTDLQALLETFTAAKRRAAQVGLMRELGNDQ